MDALNDVKRDLALAVSLAVAAALLMAVLALPSWIELAVLAAVGVLCAGWVALRTRSAVRRLQRSGARDGAPQE